MAATVILAVCGVATYALFRADKRVQQTSVSPSLNDTPTEQPSQVPTKEVPTGTVIQVGSSKYGEMLFSGSNQAIYIWQLEESTTPECYGDCAKAWPPVLTTGTPVASTGVNAQLLGTTKRTDGTTQITYNGHPLYYYAHEAPGEVECHNIKTHGGLWWVIQPSGVRAR